MSLPDGPCLDHEAIMKLLTAMFDVMAGHVNACTEVVLHDLTRPDASITAIVNGHVSGRTLNESILAGPSDDRAFEALLEPIVGDGSIRTRTVRDYVSVTQDNRRLLSSTVIIFGPKGEPAGSLCVNVDTTRLEHLRQQVLQFVSPPAQERLPMDAQERTIDDLVDEIIHDAVRASGTSIDRMTKPEKVAAVNSMNRRGLFLIKGAVDIAAQRLGTTKFTIYNYLEEIGAKRRPLP